MRSGTHPTIISVINTKGGCGKSTVSINLAAALAYRGEPTLLVDTDENGTSLEWSSRRGGALSALDVVSMPHANALRTGISNLAAKYSFVIIDGAPKLEELMTVSVAVSNAVVIPVIPSPNDLWKLGPMIELVQRARSTAESFSGREVKVFFVLNNFMARTRMSREAASVLAGFPFPVLASTLGQRMDYRDSLVQGTAAVDSENPKARDEVLALLEELHRELAGPKSIGAVAP